MRVIVGTYRGCGCIPGALRSIEFYLAGVDDLALIEDSGDPDNAAWMRQYGTVIEIGRKGYGEGMKAACKAAEGREALWFEDDFTVIESVELQDISEVLYHRQYLAKVAPLRGPHFPPFEHRPGGVFEALFARVQTLVDVNKIRDWAIKNRYDDVPVTCDKNHHPR